MKSLFFYTRLYLLLVGKYLQARMQYRADFLISTAGMILGNVAAIGAVWVVFRTIPNLAGYTYPQVIFLYAFALLALTPMQLFFDNLWSLRMATNQGTFIKYYFKPLPTLFYFVSETLDLKGFGLLAFGLGAFVWASGQLGIQWTPVRIVLLPLLLGGGSLIFISLMTIAASATFWVKDSFAILAFVSGFRDHARYPMGIYNSFFQFLFTWVVPVGYVAYYPAQFYLTDTVPDWTAWVSPLFAAALFALAVWIWNRGTRRWGGTGS